jgi:hypothetical protein
MILKCLDDDDKGICRSFFPPMFGEDGNNSSSNEEAEEAAIVDKVATNNKYIELRRDYNKCRDKAKNEYDFFNLVERCILGMEDDEVPGKEKEAISEEELEHNGLD